LGYCPERIRIAWAGASPSSSAIWVIQEKKLLQKQGVEPEIISINASPPMLQALLAGDIDVSATSVATLVTSRLSGIDTVMILGTVRTFVDHIIAAPGITTVEQLKGKVGGVNRIGSTSDLGLRFALKKVGVEPDRDAKIIPVGRNPERLAALSKGVIQFTIMPEPFLREATKLGFRDLFDISSLKIPFWWNAVLSREAIVKEKRPVLLKFVRAMIEAFQQNKQRRNKGHVGEESRNLRPGGPRTCLSGLHRSVPGEPCANAGRSQNASRRHGAAQSQSCVGRSSSVRRYEFGARGGGLRVYQATLQKIAGWTREVEILPGTATVPFVAPAVRATRISAASLETG
jgi:hypothetical protein